jgi:hypothetical protein
MSVETGWVCSHTHTQPLHFLVLWLGNTSKFSGEHCATGIFYLKLRVANCVFYFYYYFIIMRRREPTNKTYKQKKCKACQTRLHASTHDNLDPFAWSPHPLCLPVCLLRLTIPCVIICCSYLKRIGMIPLWRVFCERKVCNVMSFRSFVARMCVCVCV